MIKIKELNDQIEKIDELKKLAKKGFYNFLYRVLILIIINIISLFLLNFIGFLNENIFWQIILFNIFMTMAYAFFKIIIQKKPSFLFYRNQELQQYDFIIFSKKDTSKMEEIIEKFHPEVHKNLALKPDMDQSYIYMNIIKKESLNNVIKNLRTILKDLNENHLKELKMEVFEYILNTINKKDFNENKSNLIDILESGFYDDEEELYLLNKIEKLKTKYDEEVIREKKMNLKKKILSDKQNIELKKVIINI